MSTKDFTANVISATKVVPDGNFKDSKASGIWDINEALDLIKGGNWPNVANFSPSAFVDGLFSVDLWDGSGSSRSITNGINLSNSGGLVWYKGRDTGGQGAAQRHSLYDTERGVTKRLISSENHAEATESTALTAFNTTGFTIGGDAETNQSNYDYVSWTFREQPKFFDIVKYEGTGSDRTVAHSLGTTVGMIIIKNIDQTDNWAVYHREAYDQNAGADYVLHLNTNSARTNSSDYFNDTAPTSSVFTVGTDHTVNADGENYVAYLFAHNDGDGGFGEPGDQDIIKCGSYTGNGSATGPTVNLGFEPQWLMIKRTDTGGAGYNWFIFDAMRGMPVGGADQYLSANLSDAEAGSSERFKITPTGFQLASTSGSFNASGGNYIYMAIRRGGMQTPTAASSVFHVNKFTSTGFTEYTGVGFAPDLAIQKAVSSGDNWDVVDKLRGPSKYIKTNSTDAEATDTQYELGGFLNNGVKMGSETNGQFNGWNPNLHLYWRRARGYFDIVPYTGTGNARTVTHNLSVAPEMMWIKNRTDDETWIVYTTGVGNAAYLVLSGSGAKISEANIFQSTDPTASVFSVGADISVSSKNYIAYLFATVANVSKVGSFTQSGATNVDCGFTGDTPSFLLLKRTDDGDNWRVYDAARGLVAGNDKVLNINRNVAQSDDSNLINPNSGGFATTSTLTNGDYIFYAIASIA